MAAKTPLAKSHKKEEISVEIQRKKKSLSRILQWLVVATSVPPLKQLYVGCYWLIIWYISRRLAREPGIVAVYLKGGCAKGETVPGISDIDLAVISDYGPDDTRFFWDKHPLKTRKGWYERLVQRSALFESDVSNYKLGHLQALFDLRLLQQYRMTEGKATWKLLRGKDYLAALPQLGERALHAPLYNETAWWWRLFIRHILQKPENTTDPLTCNGLCYRICCGIVKTSVAMHTGLIRFHRKGALESASPFLHSGEQQLIDEVLRLKKQRYLPAAPQLAEDCKNMLFGYLDRFYGQLATHDFGRPVRPALVRVDSLPEEDCLPAASLRHAEKLIGHAQKQWGDNFTAAHLVPSIFFEVDDLLLLLEADHRWLPSLAQLQALLDLHREGLEDLPRQVHLYLLRPNAAFHLGMARLRCMGWDAVLTRVASPDIFAQVRAQKRSWGAGGRPELGPAWPPLIDFFVHAQKIRFVQTLQRQAAGPQQPQVAVRAFWKCAQLAILDQGAARGEAVFALTLAAIERHLSALDKPLPAPLAPLVEGHRCLVAGTAVREVACLVEAVAYLAGLDPGFAGQISASKRP